MAAPVTLNKVAYNVLNLMRGGRSTNNEYIDIEQIKFNVLYYRALLIRRSLEREQNFRKFEHDLGFVNVEVHEEAEGQSLDLTTNVARTSVLLPEFVRVKGGPAVTFVGKSDKRTRYPLVEVFESPYQSYNKYTSSAIRSYLFNDRVYLLNDSAAEAINTMLEGGEIDPNAFVESNEVINIRGIFEDPREVAEFLGKDEVELMLPMDMVQMITQSLANGELQIVSQTENDKVTDNLPDGN